MEKDVEQVVLMCVKNIMKEHNINSTCSLEMGLDRSNGIDSLVMISLIISIEEELNIDLDNRLSQIRKCKDIKGLVEIVKSVK